MNKEKDLSSSALQIYIYLLKKNPEPQPYSEIKKDLGLPKSTIHYNLDKLQKEGLVQETPNGYTVVEFQQLPALRNYISVFGKILPRYVLFSVFFAIMSIIQLLIQVVPEIRIVGFALSIFGLVWTLRDVYKYRL